MDVSITSGHYRSLAIFCPDYAHRCGARRAALDILKFGVRGRRCGLPLSAYVKSLVFVENAPIYRKSPKPVSVDRTIIAQVLSYLGQSRLAANLNQLAKAANTGSLYFDEDTRTSLIGACNDIQAIRYLLMHALGKNVPQEIQKALLSGGAE